MSPDDRRAPITPQLALRVAVLGGIALTLFAIVFFRLWFLQVLSGDQYVVQARENRTRDVRIAAPRGDIVDRSGRTIVTNRAATVVQLEPAALPEAERSAAATWGQAMGRRERLPEARQGPPVPLPPVPTAELRGRFERLGQVLGMRPEAIHRKVIEQLAVLPYANITVRSDVRRDVLEFLLERQEQFRGVAPQSVFLRRYPQGELAAQLLGYVGEVSPDELEEKRNRDVVQGTVIGKAGVEYSYDRYLRGQDGATRLRVDANGQFAGPAGRRREPTAGSNLKLSLDLDLQRAGQEALAAIGGGLPGAFVAMNPRSGAVHALGSAPSFDPSVFAKPIPPAKFAQLTSEDNGAPLVNRAIAGTYASGSTFKPITALAGLDAGVITPGSVINDGGCIIVGDAPKCNAGDAPNGPVDLRRALTVSSDVYFYLVGMDLFPLGGERLQRWSRDLGLGRETGIDLPAEREGLIPGRRWRAGINEQERRCRRGPEQDGRPCYVVDIRPYNLGDNANLSVGQGEVSISPLQMATAYSGIVTGGKVPRPHLGLEVQDAAGRLVQEIDPGPAREIDIDPTARQAVMDGLAGAAQAPGGTSTPVFSSWPHAQFPVFGKTGTAETPQGDQSWYVAYVPSKSEPLVVAVTVERGGFGAERAAPIACRMLRQWFSTDSTCAPGTSRTL